MNHNSPLPVHHSPTKGILLAILATLIWSGNFIIAREASDDIPPVSLSFYRWLTATLILFPFAWKKLRTAIGPVRNHLPYFLLTAATGVAMFNTFVYIAGHYSPAINMALLGTTTSPIISVILAAILLKERVTWLRVAGMIVCISGILLLLSNGSMQRLLSFQFTKGDVWILAAALSFAIYNTMVKKKPKELSAVHFLFVCFFIGTVMLFPFYMIELNQKGAFTISSKNIFYIIYLGLGTSVLAFLIWNEAIKQLGAGRTALFGNLIPVFSAIEAVILLNENITWIHVGSFLLVIVGLIIANLQMNKRRATPRG